MSSSPSRLKVLNSEPGYSQNVHLHVNFNLHSLEPILQVLVIVQALIFVIDSNDKDRITEARDELQQLLKNSELSNAKLLVFANKQDMAKVLTPKEITDWLYLNRLKERDWHVQPCSATTGEGLREGLDWLANALKDNNSCRTTNTTKTNGVGSPQTPRTPRTPRWCPPAWQPKSVHVMRRQRNSGPWRRVSNLHLLDF